MRLLRANTEAPQLLENLVAVLNDNTVRYGGAVIDIPPGPGGRSYAKAKVELRQFLDGSWRVYRSGAVIAIQSATEVGELRAKTQRKRSAASREFRHAVTHFESALP